MLLMEWMAASVVKREERERHCDDNGLSGGFSEGNGNTLVGVSVGLTSKDVSGSGLRYLSGYPTCTRHQDEPARL